MSDLEAVSDPFLASAAKRIPSIGGTMTTLSMKTYTRIYINIFIFYTHNPVYTLHIHYIYMHYIHTYIHTYIYK